MKDFIKNAGAEAGFAAVGVTTAEPVDALGHLEAAAREGRIADMRFLARDPAGRCCPRSLLPAARSVICCALAYGEEGLAASVRPSTSAAQTGRARFARGAEYHEAVRNKLGRLWEAIALRAPGAQAKLCVDTSPVLEKALAARAGIGWIGKHTVLVNEALGSWFVLGEIITDLALAPDAPVPDRCGDCRRCLDACPTGALPHAHTLDARRCTSYLTIEASRSAGATGSRDDGEALVYGCDACLEACPYSAR